VTSVELQESAAELQALRQAVAAVQGDLREREAEHEGGMAVLAQLMYVAQLMCVNFQLRQALKECEALRRRVCTCTCAAVPCRQVKCACNGEYDQRCDSVPTRPRPRRRRPSATAAAAAQRGRSAAGRRAVVAIRRAVTRR
jgi:hypothetical protein